MANLPAEPPGDVAQLQASIAQLRALQTQVRDAIDRPSNRLKSYSWDLGKTGDKVENLVKDARTLGKQAVTEIDSAITELQAEVRRVSAAKNSWQAQCRAITAAERS